MSKRAVRLYNGKTISVAGEADITAIADEPAKFAMVLYNGGPIRPGGWNAPHPLVLDLAGMSVIRGGSIPFNRGHVGDNALVGHGTAEVTATQIVINDGVFSFDNQYTKEIIEASKAGFKWASSMEATIQGTPKFVPKGQTVRVNGRQIPGPVYVAKKSELFAGAFIGSNPADRSTEVSIAAMEEHMVPQELKEWLEGRGVDVESLSEEQITAWSADFNQIKAKSEQEPLTVEAKGNDGADEGDHVAEITARAVAEKRRIRQIGDIFAGRFAEVEEKCIANGLDVEAATREFKVAELEDEKSRRPQAGPAIHASGSEDLLDSNVMAAGLHSSMDPAVRDSDVLVECYGERQVELAKKLPKHFGLEYLALSCIRAAGGSVTYGQRLNNELFAMAVRADRVLQGNRDIHAASSFSTMSLTDTLSNLAHKSLLMMYKQYPTQVERLCSVAEHSDFKLHTKVAVEGQIELEKLPPTGEIKHGSMSDTKYTNIVYTWAKMLGISRHDFINDDLGAFQRNAQELGRGAMKSREKLMFATLLDTTLLNNFFKTSGQATGTEPVNHITSGALSVAGLEAAELLMKQMKDVNGDPIMISPDALLTGTALAKTAENLLSFQTTSVVDSNDSAGTPSTELRVENSYLGRFVPVVSPWIDAGNSITGASDKVYFLFGEKDFPAVEYARLRGESTPNIDTADTDFNTLGFQTRVYWDYGFNVQDPRGIVRVDLP